jgi:hypothetical protein
LGKVVGINVIKQAAEVMLESGAIIQVPVDGLQAPKRSGGVDCDAGGGNCCKTKRPNTSGEKTGLTSAREGERPN